MPNIGPYHPIIVHFAIALVILGVIFRWISLTGRAPFTGPAAATGLILGAVAAALAVHSGLDAHGPVERIPEPGRQSWIMRTRAIGHGTSSWSSRCSRSRLSPPRGAVSRWRAWRCGLSGGWHLRLRGDPEGRGSWRRSRVQLRRRRRHALGRYRGRQPAVPRRSLSGRAASQGPA